MGPCAELCRAMLGWAGLLQHHCSCNAHRCRGQAECKAATRLRDRLVCAYMRVSAHATPTETDTGTHARVYLASSRLVCLLWVRSHHGHWAVWHVTQTEDGLFLCFLERLSILSFLWARVLLHIPLWVGVCKLWRSPSKAYESGRTLWGFIGW